MTLRRDPPGRACGTAAAGGSLLLAALALLLAACGGSGGGPARPGSSGPAATAAGSQAPRTATPAGPAALTVRSPSFADGDMIPARFSCHGGNTPPSLTWAGVPASAGSIALVMDDPDAPGGTYTHWVVFNLPAAARGIASGQLPAGAATAQNSGGQAAYLGPCPPSGTHHYRFTVYAEPRRLALPAGAGLAQALRTIKAAALARGRLTGRFSA